MVLACRPAVMRYSLWQLLLVQHTVIATPVGDTNSDIPLSCQAGNSPDDCRKLLDPSAYTELKNGMPICRISSGLRSLSLRANYGGTTMDGALRDMKKLV